MKKFALPIFVFIFLHAETSLAAKRTVMIQLFQWNWNSIAEECERELGPMGIAAVQVSPPQEHIVLENSPWWERYQPVSYKIHSRSGTREEFRSMVARCKSAGVDVYADVVLNHMTAFAQGVGFAGTPYRHYFYENLWSPESFHRCGRNGNNGLVDFFDRFELHNCDLLGMADLHTGKIGVQRRLADYLNDLLDLGVAGFRIDAAKHISPEDLHGIFRFVQRSHYRVLELILSPGEPVSAEEYRANGDINNFAYAYQLGEAFTSGDIRSLPTLAWGSGISSDDAVVFLENHDLERRPDSEPILSFRKSSPAFRLAMTFLLTWPYGYPQLYSGLDFTDYDAGSPVRSDGFLEDATKLGVCQAPFNCMHRLPWVRDLVKFRNFTDEVFRVTSLVSGWDFLSYGRGSLGHVVLNASSQRQHFELKTDLTPGKYCNNLRISETANLVCGEVDGRGVLRITLPGLTPWAVVSPFLREKFRKN